MGYLPPVPELRELPAIEDAKASGLRLQGTLPKALPKMPDGSSGSPARAEEAAIYLRDMGISFAESKAREARSRAISRMKNRAAERSAKPMTEQAVKSGSAFSRRNTKYAKNTSLNAAYTYGYDPYQAMRS